MKTDNPQPAPKKEPKKSKATIELEALRQQLTETRASLDEANRELIRLSEESSAKITTLTTQIGIARAALKPLHDKTKKWEWPPAETAVWDKLTWGEIRRAAGAYLEIT